MVVGRDVVLDTFGAALVRSMAGRGRLVLLEGEAGIGKTTVVRTVADRAEAADAVVRWAACWEGSASLPFGLWLDALRHPAHDACAQAADQLEHGRHEAADGATDAGAADRVRARFFVTVADALRLAALDRPQVIVLEDIHWADAGSLALLRALARQLPGMAALVVATFRSEELASAEALGGLGGAAEHLTLVGLTVDDVSALLAEVLGRAPTADEAGELHRRTGGNPLFVTQVGRLLAAGSSSTAVPAGVKDVLNRRLARMSPGCDRILGAAAVIGTEFDAAVIASMLSEPEEQVLAHIDEAVSARLVVAAEGKTRRWRFLHELVRAARYDSLGAVERAELHRRAVDVLEGSDAPAGLLAHHAARGRFDPADQRPARVAVAAAREAVTRLAWPEAVALAERALDAVPPDADADDVRAEAWLALGDARLRTGDDLGAAAAFVSAAAVGRARRRPELVARAALGFGAGLGSFEVRLLDRRQIDLLDEAAAVLPEDAALRPLVLARLSVALSFVGSAEKRLELADDAVRLSRDRHDDRALAAALAARCDALAGPDHVAERVEASAEIVSLAQRAGDLALELLGRRLRIVAVLERADVAGFDAEVSAYGRTADRLGDPLYSWWVPLWRSMRAHAQGQLDEALHLVEEARSIGTSGGSLNADLLALVGRTFIALDRHDAEELDAIWAALVDRHPDLFRQEVAATAMATYIGARMGRVGEARALLARLGDSSSADAPRDQEWLAVTAQLLSAGVIVGDVPTARRGYELLLPYEGLGVFEGAAATYHGVVDRFLARGAAALGRHDDARRHVDAATLANISAGRLVLAHTRADGARALAVSTDDADRARAGALAREASADYAALGLEVAAAEIGELLSGHGSARGGTGGDRSVAALVREGDTWAVSFDGATVRIRHSKGMADLAVLVGQPGREVHVRTLEGVDHLELPSSEQPALDETAVEQYRRRLRDIETDLSEAEDDHDLGRIERLAVERDALVDQLAQAFGLGGRPRPPAGDADERLRKAVSARVKSSIEKLEDLHPVLGRHLRNSVKTGYRCVYEPERGTRWEVTTTPQA